MTSYHVNLTVVADTAEAAIGLAESHGRRLQDILEQPFVTHLSTSVSVVGDGAEEPTIGDRIAALIDYLGEARALKALENLMAGGEEL